MHAPSLQILRILRVLREKNLFSRELANQIPVAVGIVDAGDMREVLVLYIALHREASLLTAEGELPLVGHQHLGGVRRVADDVVVVSAKGFSQSLMAQYISGKKKASKAARN